MPRQLLGTAIASNTITTTQLQTTVVNQISAGGGPRVSSLIYPGDDTAANTVGGQTVYVTGSGFAANANVYINGNAVPSISFISASNLAITTPALSAATYPVYVINPETGATAIHIPGLRVSGDPTWVTAAGSLAASQDEGSAWSYTVSANSDSAVTYALAGGSSLPTGISLAANGLISGTLSSPPGTETTYNFTVVATDAENQNASRAFSVTVSAGEGVLFANNVLLIHADGTNNQNNHTFLDSSNNNFTITKNGNATQGAFSPFSQTGWSNYFDGTGDYLTLPSTSSLAFGTGDFCVEMWVYFTGSPASDQLLTNISGSETEFSFRIDASNYPKVQSWFTNYAISNTAVVAERWYHLVACRASNTLSIFINGTRTANATVTNNFSSTNAMTIGGTSGTEFCGYISNLRITKGSSPYDPTQTTITVPTAPLTAVSNTSLLTCQSNRFRDASNNNFTITRNGDVSVQAFSPFAPTAAYSTANVGGSGYFDGTDDYLTWSGTTLSGNFTVECWVYKIAVDASGYTNVFSGSDGNHQLAIDQTTAGSISLIIGSSTIIGASGTAVTPYAWHHLAWVREGSTCRVYVNGVQQGSGTSSTSFAIGTIGRFYGGGYEMNGYISGARIVAGTCLYPSGTTFTPPTSPPTNIANTSLLCNFTNAGIFDQTAKNILETVGDAKVSTAQYKYGTGSMVFDGTGDGLFVPYNPNLVMSGNFTIEFWINFTSKTGYQTIYSFGYGISGDIILQTGNGDGKIVVYTGNPSAAVATDSGSTVNTSQWYHIAVVRNGSTITIYRDGVSVGSGTSATAHNPSTASTLIIGGGSNSGFNNYYFNGYIDDLRVTKGYARYTSNFTPPTSALKDK
jgi:hypothetical protein